LTDPVGAVKVTTGAVVSTVNETVSVSVPPGPSATTTRVWLPSDSPDFDTGDVHAAAATPSSEHVTVSTSPVVENPTVTDDTLISAEGADEITTSGGVTMRNVADSELVFPAGSVAETVTVCEPSEAKDNGLVQGPAGTPGAEQVVVAVASSTVKLTDCGPTTAPLGAVRVTAGGVVSTVNDADSLSDPPGPLATTVKVWAPSVRVNDTNGDVQLVAAPPSIEQDCVATSPVATHSADTAAVLTSAAGAVVIVTSGGTTMMNDTVAEAALPRTSVAVTVTEWTPGDVNDSGLTHAALLPPSIAQVSTAASSAVSNTTV
jgi:hypothetical protein